MIQLMKKRSTKAERGDFSERNLQSAKARWGTTSGSKMEELKVRIAAISKKLNGFQLALAAFDIPMALEFRIDGAMKADRALKLLDEYVQKTEEAITNYQLFARRK